MTVSVEERLPVSVTVSWKVSRAPVSPTRGAVRVGVTVVAPLRVALGPAVWVQEKVSVSPSGSLDAVADRVTEAPSVTV